MKLNILVSYGLTALIIESPIFGWLRWAIKKTPVAKLASCYQCMGFWIGLGVGWWSGERGLELVAFAVAAGGVCFFLSRLTSPSPPGPP